jgi:galactarate dehydratase
LAPSRCIRVHERDNVAIVVDPEGARSGAEFSGGLTAREHIPQSHKIAISTIERGSPVLRYGQIIGRANQAIPAGSWVREENHE